MPGLTAAGLVIRTQPELEELVKAKVAAAIPGIDLSEGPEHQIIGAATEEIAIAYEGVQAVNASFGRDASGIALDRVMALTGSTRRAATRSLVACTVNLNAGITLAAGRVAAVADDPDAQFRLVEAVTNSGGSPADVPALFESVRTGAVVAPADRLTRIVTAQAGWNTITNAADATLGRPVAEDPEARASRETELSGAGGSRYEAIRARVARVAGVESVAVFGNETLVTDGDGRPPKSFEVVVWDSDPTAADDDAIAQAIYESYPAGISPYGDGESGDSTRANGAVLAVPFTRATILRVYALATVELEAGAGTGWEDLVAAAIEERASAYVVGGRAWANHLTTQVDEDVPAVDGIQVELALTAFPTAGASSITATYTQIIRIDAADVTVEEG